MNAQSRERDVPGIVMILVLGKSHPEKDELSNISSKRGCNFWAKSRISTSWLISVSRELLNSCLLLKTQIYRSQVSWAERDLDLRPRLHNCVSYSFSPISVGESTNRIAPVIPCQNIVIGFPMGRTGCPFEIRTKTSYVCRVCRTIKSVTAPSIECLVALVYGVSKYPLPLRRRLYVMEVKDNVRPPQGNGAWYSERPSEIRDPCNTSKFPLWPASNPEKYLLLLLS